MLTVTPDLTLPDDELTFRTSRSSGPGGQHVNKAETRVTVLFDVAGSPTLSEEQKEKVLETFPTRISKAGVMSVSAQRHRSQAANREAAVERLGELLREALEGPPERVPTRAPRRVHRKRLEEKRRRGRLKKERAGPSRWEE